MPVLPGPHLIDNYTRALEGGSHGAGSTAAVGRMMFVSLVSALIITFGKIAISLLSAFAIVYFRFRFRMVFFWAIFVTLMLPVEVRIGPTYKVVSDLGMLNSFAGLTVPLIASATATFLFRQFFLTVPEELVEAARIDGAGPMRFSATGELNASLTYAPTSTVTNGMGVVVTHKQTNLQFMYSRQFL